METAGYVDGDSHHRNSNCACTLVCRNLPPRRVADLHILNPEVLFSFHLISSANGSQMQPVESSLERSLRRLPPVQSINKATQ